MVKDKIRKSLLEQGLTLSSQSLDQLNTQVQKNIIESLDLSKMKNVLLYFPYKQEIKTLNQNSFFRRLKVFIFKPKVYGFTFASFVISYVFIPQILISRNFVDVDEINDFVTYEIIEDL